MREGSLNDVVWSTMWSGRGWLAQGKLGYFGLVFNSLVDIAHIVATKVNART